MSKADCKRKHVFEFAHALSILLIVLPKNLSQTELVTFRTSHSNPKVTADVIRKHADNNIAGLKKPQEARFISLI